MRRIIRHLAVPAAVALAFFAVAAMPVEVLGCRGGGSWPWASPSPGHWQRWPTW
jgi:hypothetical protein